MTEIHILIRIRIRSGSTGDQLLEYADPRDVAIGRHSQPSDGPFNRSDAEVYILLM